MDLLRYPDRAEALQPSVLSRSRETVCSSVRSSVSLAIYEYDNQDRAFHSVG